CITLISQAKKMLQRLLESQQRQFLEHGGIRELMYRARTEARQHPDTND
ncbi:MAG: four helix bundle suffix domain-containing protein, partial [Paramuribaculum sp.]|nr:four helix bundle suffix domain-containing protein [Paramuribaculum sp.]